jgi:SAM-dependent methyltransferase
VNNCCLIENLIMFNKIISFATSKFSRQTLIKLSYTFGFMIRPVFWGNKVECPVCKRHFRKFLPYGYGTAKDNRLCPGCLSLERHRLLYLYLKEKTNFFTDNLTVLHFAPEQPFLKRFRKCKNLKYTTADLDSPIADIQLDVTKIDLPDNSYDVVICNHVLEHVTDANIAMKEIYRILKPDGWAIMLVPINPDIDTFEDPSVTDPKERERLFGQYDHVRQFGRDYPDYIAKAGFDEVIVDDLYYSIPEKDRERMKLARPGEEYIYGGRKK